MKLFSNHLRRGDESILNRLLRELPQLYGLNKIILPNFAPLSCFEFTYRIMRREQNKKKNFSSLTCLRAEANFTQIVDIFRREVLNRTYFFSGFLFIFFLFSQSENVSVANFLFIRFAPNKLKTHRRRRRSGREDQKTLARYFGKQTRSWNRPKLYPRPRNQNWLKYFTVVEEKTLWSIRWCCLWFPIRGLVLHSSPPRNRARVVFFPSWTSNLAALKSPPPVSSFSN